MSEQNISVANALAWGLWALATLGVTLGMFGYEGLGRAGLLVGLAAGTLHLRDHASQQRYAMENAFQVGRDVGRLESVPAQRIK